MMLKTKDSGLGLDIKAVGDDGVVEGYASVWNVVDSADEAVVRGAFKASLAESRRQGRSIKMLHQHNRDEVIGIWDELNEDERGLRVKGRLLIDAVPLAKTVHGLLLARALDELSIGYREIETKKDPARPGVLLLKQVQLREISIVTFGALGVAARIDSVKSLLEGGDLPSVRHFEDFLREAGFSKSLATVIASKAAPHLRRESEGRADDAINFLNRLIA